MIKRLASTWLVSLILVFSIPVSAQAQATAELTTLVVADYSAEARSAAHVSWGVPLSRTENITSADSLRLERSGREVAFAQFTPTARWGGAVSDSSKPIAWVIIDATVDLPANETASFSLVRGARSAASSALRIAADTASGIAIETGAATFEVSRQNFRVLNKVTRGAAVTENTGGIFLNGQARVGPATIEVEQRGPTRISLRAHGVINGGLEYTARLHFSRNSDEVKVDFRLENFSAPASNEYGQVQANNYGSAGSVRFDDLSLVFTGRGENTYRFPLNEDGAAPRETSGAYQSSVTVTQDSSGTPRWNALASSRFSPRIQSAVVSRASTYKIDSAAMQNGPNQIEGWFDANGITVGVEKAWQNFPKSFRARSGRVEIGLFPSEFGQDQELRAGEMKTHSLFVRFHEAAENDIGSRSRSLLERYRFAAPAEYVMQTQAAGLFAPRSDSAFSAYERGVDGQVAAVADQDTTLFDSIDRWQFYGWSEYGDIPTDFEQGSSPYTFKYDGLRGSIYQCLKNGTSSLARLWCDLSAAGSRHSADIDIQHGRRKATGADRPWWEGGMYGHIAHDEAGITNPHRNMMNPNPSMAGPNAGQFLWAMMSGDTLLLDSAAELADNTQWRMTRTNYGQLGGSARQIAESIGLQQCNADAYECNGYAVDDFRSFTNAMSSLRMGYLATGNPAYLDTLAKLAEFRQRYELSRPNFESTKGACNRFHMEALFVANLGDYLLMREAMGLSEDHPARELLARRMNYMRTRLYNANRPAQPFQICYIDQDENGAVTAADFAYGRQFVDNNWLLPVADAFAVGGLVLNDNRLVNEFARRAFEFGSTRVVTPGNPVPDNPGPTAVGYYSTKEFVNQLTGNMFLYAYWRLNGRQSGAPPVLSAVTPATPAAPASIPSSSATPSVQPTMPAAAPTAVPSVASTSPLTLLAEADTSIDSEPEEANMGAMQNLKVRMVEDGREAALALVRFPQVAARIPSGARITSATLQFFHSATGAAGTRSVCADPVSASWEEGSGTHDWDTQAGGVTWSTWPQSILNTARCAPLGATNRWIEFNVSDAIRAGQRSFSLRARDASWRRDDFDSRESANGPRLMVSFEVPSTSVALPPDSATQPPPFETSIDLTDIRPVSSRLEQGVHSFSRRNAYSRFTFTAPSDGWYDFAVDWRANRLLPQTFEAGVYLRGAGVRRQTQLREITSIEFKPYTYSFYLSAGAPIDVRLLSRASGGIIHELGSVAIRSIAARNDAPVIKRVDAVPGRGGATFTVAVDRPATITISIGGQEARNPTATDELTRSIQALRRQTEHRYEIEVRDIFGNTTTSSGSIFVP